MIIKEKIELNKTNEIQVLIASIGTLLKESSLSNLEVVGLLEMLKHEVRGFK